MIILRQHHLVLLFCLLFCFACTQQTRHNEEKALTLSEIENSVEHLEKGFVLASQDEYALDVPEGGPEIVLDNLRTIQLLMQ